MPFNSLLAGTYLHNRCPSQTYEILIDCFRWCRSGDDDARRTMVPDDLLLSGEDSQREFAVMIRNARHHSNLLPRWFDEDEALDCVAYAQQREEFSLEDEPKPETYNHRWQDSYMTDKLALLGSLIFHGKAETLRRGQGVNLEAYASIEREIVAFRKKSEREAAEKLVDEARKRARVEE